MGLSDEERTTKIYFGLKHLSEITKRMREDKKLYGAESFLSLMENAWHAFLGNQRNSAHWIMGSSTDNTIRDGNAPWDVAIQSHLTNCFPTDDKETQEDREFERKLFDDTPFNAREYCSIPHLLQERHNNLEAYVFEAYRVMEWLIYSLRRYDDDYRRSFPELDRLISEFQGLAFGLFSQNEDYAKAYLIHEIMGLLYEPKYPYGDEESYDFVTRWLDKECVHHDLPRQMKSPIEDLTKWHVALVKADFADRRDQGKRLFETRLSVLIDVHRSLYRYPHIRKEFEAALSEVDSKLRQRVKAQLERNQKAFDADKAEDEAEQTEEYELKNLMVYGHEGYSALWDLSAAKEQMDRRIEKSRAEEKKAAAAKRAAKKRPAKRKR